MPKLDLLPCPFCGKPDTAKIITVAECDCMDNPTEWDRTHYGVVCDNSIEGGCGASTGWNHETPEDAAKEWNTRASGWIPCSKMMPEDDEEVLFAVIYPWDKKTRVTLGRRRTKKNGESWWSNGYCHFSDYDVTHWMPLPEPPKRKDDTHDYD